MVLGIPRGFFYYDYMGFIRKLLADTDVTIQVGKENSEEILESGKNSTVDEACSHIKLFAGQVEALSGQCDKILIPRITKDCRGKWLCPKLLGLPELVANTSSASDLLVTKPICFHNEKNVKKAMNRLWRELNLPKMMFQKNFENAYRYQKEVSEGSRMMDLEPAWELKPPVSAEGEIVLPDLGKVLVIGHNYNVYDKFANGDIVRKLDKLGLGTVTEHQVRQNDQYRAIGALPLMKEPFWEAFARIIGTALCLRTEVEGMIYLSSFSCGLDAFLVQMLKTHVPELPLLVLKLDEHKGEAGFETRIEAFADLLEKRRVS